jgi:hypothetical protein
MVLVPHCGLEPLAAGVADGDIGKDEVTTIGNQAVGQEPPEVVVLRGAEDVVA